MASLQYVKSANLQTVTLGSDYTAGSGTMTLTTGEGANLPSSGDFWLTYDNGTGTIRIFKVTARSSDTLTVYAVSGEGNGDGNLVMGDTLRWALTVDALDQLKADIVSSGGLVLLEQHTASSSASLDFTSSISSSYDVYKIVLSNILPATNNAQTYFKVSTDGGSSWIGGTSYTWSNFRWNGGGTVPSGSGGSVAQIALNTQQTNSTTSQGFNAVIYLTDPLSTTRYKNLQGTGTGDTGTFDGFLIYGGYNSTTAVNAFQILMSSGNIASGTVYCYGLSK